MPTTLGLHIDVKSIGWTLVDSESKRIKSMGVHVFPTGSKNFGFGKREMSKRSQRRQQRIIRIRFARKRARKVKLLLVLSKYGLCPGSQKAISNWKKTKLFPAEELESWLRLNPYALRVKALEEPITLMELGRIFYHVAQRRGFPLTERSIESSNGGLFRGFPRSNRRGIKELQPHLTHQTLGVYLSQLYPLPYQSYRHAPIRIRNRFIARSMYQNELEAIWEVQKPHHSILTDELKIELIGGNHKGKKQPGIIFFQRPLKSQKHKVGKCLYEPQKTKCCVSSLTYQEVLAYRWVNTLLKNGVPLDTEERERVVRYFLTHRKFTFEAVIRLLDASNSQFNKKSDELIIGSFVFSEFSKKEYFGSEWFDFDAKTREDIWHVLYFFKDQSKLVSYAELHWGFSSFHAQKISRMTLDKRYAPISKKAARNILFFLKRGVVYDLAVVLGGVKNALSKHWDEIAEKDITFITNKVIELYKQFPFFGFTMHLKEFLTDYLQLNEFQISKLYGQNSRILQTNSHSKFEFSKKADDEVYRFQSPPLITALFQARKVINAIVEEHGPLDHIKIQLNTKLKVNKYQRYFYKLDKKRISHNHIRYCKILEELTVITSPSNILKYQLWEECQHTCPYSGEKIPLERLFTKAIQIVYIHPWSRSLNDASLNKTLCVSYIAEDLNQYTPFEFFNEYRAYQWGEVVERASRLFENTSDFPSNHKKFRLFIKRYNKRNVLKNHLQDPNFISQELRCFFTQVCPDVSVVLNYASLHLRKHWKLDAVLLQKGSSKDIREVALHSYISTLLDTTVLTELLKWDRYRVAPNSEFPIPYKEFKQQVEYHLSRILVSHLKANRIYVRRKIHNPVLEEKNLGVAVRGKLHKETVYSYRRAPTESSYSFHIRKPIESFLTETQVHKIVDPVIKKIVLDRITAVGGFQNGRVPPTIFMETNAEGFRIPKLFVPNKKGGDPVPISSVRIKETFNGAVKLKANENMYVNPRNNHHILIYKSGAEIKEDIVTLWEAVRRKAAKEPLYQLTVAKAEALTTLHSNDLFLLGIQDLDENIEKESRSFLSKHLYRVQKLSSMYYEFRLAYHQDISYFQTPEFIRITNFGDKKTGWKTLNPIKVNVSYAGNITRAKSPLKKLTNTPSML